MWSYLIAVPFLSVLTIIQSAIVSRIPLLEGQADLMLVAVVGWALQERAKGIWFWVLLGGGLATVVSAMPFGVYLASYSLSAGLALLLKKRVWRAPFLAMIGSVFLGTFILDFISAVIVTLQGVSLQLMEVINFVVVPSVLLNLLLCVPMYIVIRDIAGWLNPEMLKV